MTKLKTLKDLDVFIEDDRTMWNAGARNFMKKAKEEAIKWVKKDIKDYKENVQVPGNIEINSYTMFVIKKWMERFNITEEDLI